MRSTTNFSYPADQMPCMGNSNRSRLDSGTSGSSESSRGSGNGKPRKRSHRPRGCRGGSNRRRNNSADEKNKRTNNGSNHVNNENIPRLDNTTVLLKNKNKAAKGKGKGKETPKLEVSILSRQTPSLKGGPVDYGANNYQNYEMTAPITDYAFHSNTSTENLSSFYHNVNSFDIPGIQPSFSDSSSDTAFGNRVVPAMQASFAPPGLDRSGHILPPLAYNRVNEEAIPCGPNPYALKLTTHDSFYPQQNVHQSGPTQQQSHYVCHPGPQYNNDLRLGHNQNHNYDYKAERLEKQRQTVVGGSLFVTSPRSFLMGLTN